MVPSGIPKMMNYALWKDDRKWILNEGGFSGSEGRATYRSYTSYKTTYEFVSKKPVGTNPKEGSMMDFATGRTKWYFDKPRKF